MKSSSEDSQVFENSIELRLWNIASPSHVLPQTKRYEIKTLEIKLPLLPQEYFLEIFLIILWAFNLKSCAILPNGWSGRNVAKSIKFWALSAAKYSRIISHTVSGNEGDVEMVSGESNNVLLEGIEIFSKDLHWIPIWEVQVCLFYVKASIVYRKIKLNMFFFISNSHFYQFYFNVVYNLEVTNEITWISSRDVFQMGGSFKVEDLKIDVSYSYKTYWIL